MKLLNEIQVITDSSLLTGFIQKEHLTVDCGDDITRDVYILENQNPLIDKKYIYIKPEGLLEEISEEYFDNIIASLNKVKESERKNHNSELGYVLINVVVTDYLVQNKDNISTVEKLQNEITSIEYWKNNFLTVEQSRIGEPLDKFLIHHDNFAIKFKEVKYKHLIFLDREKTMALRFSPRGFDFIDLTSNVTYELGKKLKLKRIYDENGNDCHMGIDPNILIKFRLAIATKYDDLHDWFIDAIRKEFSQEDTVIINDLF